MSIHKSLLISSKLKRHRNVLKRGERIEILAKKGIWKEESSVFGLPKVLAGAKMKKVVKVKEKKEEGKEEAK
ncbi:MAG: small basic protein [Candidatus Brocadiae bacterium]|nr:small basic protein [Candidatus Brocadiia bacterium]